MKPRKHENKNGEYLTLQQACMELNLGENTVRRIANEAGAVRKIGRCCRINKLVFFDYIEKEYAE